MKALNKRQTYKETRITKKDLKRLKGLQYRAAKLVLTISGKYINVHLCLQSSIGYPWTSTSSSNFYCMFTNVSTKWHRLTLSIY